jgi:hypothetical protein
MVSNAKPLKKELDMTHKKQTKRRLAFLGKVFGGIILLTIVIHTLAVMLTGNSVRKAKEAMIASGYPMSTSEIIPPPIEDSINAAMELKKVFGLLTLGSDEMYSPGKLAGKVAKEYEDILKHYDSKRDTPYSHKHLTQLAEAFSGEDSNRIFQLITDVAAKKEAQFKRDYSAGPKLLLPELGLHRKVCQMLAVRAMYEAQKSNKAEALRLLRECLIIGDLFRREPILISQLCRLANFSISLGALQLISTSFELDGSELDDLYKLLTPYTDPSLFIKGIHGERLLYGQWFFDGRKPVEEAWWGEPAVIFLYRWYRWYPIRPLCNADHTSYLNLMRVQTQLLEKDFNLAVTGDMDRIAQQEIGTFSFLTKMISPPLSKVSLNLVKSKSLLEMTQIGIACNQFKHRKGSYPKSLDDLNKTPMESVTGKPYQFLRTKKAIYIYSDIEIYDGSLVIDINHKTEKVHGVKINL